MSEDIILPVVWAFQTWLLFMAHSPPPPSQKIAAFLTFHWKLPANKKGKCWVLNLNVFKNSDPMCLIDIPISDHYAIFNLKVQIFMKKDHPPSA